MLFRSWGGRGLVEDGRGFVEDGRGFVEDGEEPLGRLAGGGAEYFREFGAPHLDRGKESPRLLARLAGLGRHWSRSLPAGWVRCGGAVLYK